MDLVFIDTSIWVAENFTKGQRIKQLLKLSEDKNIQIILPQITYNEILKKSKEFADDALVKLTKANKDLKIFKNSERLKSLFIEVDIETFKYEFYIELNELFNKSNVEIIPYPELNIGEVFDKYFDKQFPFGEQSKKYEFPDAFALVSLEEYARVNNYEIIVLSTDRDLRGYKSNLLSVEEDYQIYLSNKLKSVQEHLQYIEDFENAFNVNRIELENKLYTWVDSQLDDSFNYEYVADGLEVYSVDVEYITVDLNYGFEFISVGKDEIIVEITSDVAYSLKIEIDDENLQVYDGSTKQMHFFGTRKKEIDDWIEVPIKLKFTDYENDSEGFIEIIEFNDGRDLYITD